MPMINGKPFEECPRCLFRYGTGRFLTCPACTGVPDADLRKSMSGDAEELAKQWVRENPHQALKAALEAHQHWHGCDCALGRINFIEGKEGESLAP